jgi:hypothetical protein
MVGLLMVVACGGSGSADDALPDTVVPYTRSPEPSPGDAGDTPAGPGGTREPDGAEVPPDEPRPDDDAAVVTGATAEEQVRALVDGLIAANETCDVPALGRLYAEQISITFVVAGAGSTSYSERDQLLTDLELGCQAIDDYRYETIGTPEIVVAADGGSAEFSYAARELSTIDGTSFDFEVTWDAVAEPSEAGWVVVSGRGVGSPIQG